MLLSLLLLLLVIGVLFWIAQKLITAFGIIEPLRSVIYVILVLISLIALADAFGVVLPLMNRSAP